MKAKDRRTEQIVQELPQIVEGISIPTFVINKEHLIIHWNKACESLTGIRAGEMYNTSNQWKAFYDTERPVLADFIVDHVSEEVVARHYGDKYRKSALIEGAYEAEDFFPALGEGGRWLFFTAAPIRDSAGSIIGAIETLQDITERKRVEEALRESEEKLRILFETAGIGITVTDMSGTIIDINEAVLELTGFSCKEELLGRNGLDFIAERDRDRAMESMMHTIQNGQGISLELTLLRKDGTEFDAEASANVLHDRSGNPVGLVCVEKDITERKRAEEALRESERRLSNLMANLPGMAYRCKNDRHWTMRFVSEGCNGLTGYTPSELIDNRRVSYASMIHPDDREMVWDMVQDAIAQDQPFTIVYRIRTASGQEKWVWEKGNGVISEAEDAVVLEGFMTDITERKLAEEALRESEGKFRILSDQALMGIIILQDESFVYVNDCAAAIMEVPAERIANWSPGDYAKLIHPDDLAFVMEQGRKKQAGEKEVVIHYDWRMVTPGGNLKWIEMWSKSILFRGRIADMLTMIDITGRKRAEEALRESEINHRNLFEHTLLGMEVIDGETGKVVLSNHSVARIFGFKSPEDMVGTNPMDYVLPDDLEWVTNQLAQVRADPEKHDVTTLRAKTEDGRIIWVTGSTTSFEYEGKLSALISLIDVTSTKEAEEALRESEEMARSILDNAAMGIYLLQDKKFLYVNPTFEQIIGYSSEELVGQEAINYVHPDDRDTVRTKAVENIKGISALPYEFRALRKDGKQIWVMERVTSIKYKGRRAVIASFMETTEHRKAEVELERAYEELKTRWVRWQAA